MYNGRLGHNDVKRTYRACVDGYNKIFYVHVCTPGLKRGRVQYATDGGMKRFTGNHSRPRNGVASTTTFGLLQTDRHKSRDAYAPYAHKRRRCRTDAVSGRVRRDDSVVEILIWTRRLTVYVRVRIYTHAGDDDENSQSTFRWNGVPRTKSTDRIYVVIIGLET